MEILIVLYPIRYKIFNVLTESQLAAKRKWTAKNREKILAYRRDYYQKNPAKILAINKKWRDANLDQAHAIQREYFQKNQEAVTAQIKAYRKQNPDKVRAWSKKWIENNPEARQAHIILNNALKSGAVKKQPCACGKVNVHAHHEDYSKPLAVVWVCPKHHKSIHQERKQT